MRKYGFCSKTAFAPSDAMGAKQWQEPTLRLRRLLTGELATAAAAAAKNWRRPEGPWVQLTSMRTLVLTSDVCDYPITPRLKCVNAKYEYE